MTDQTADLVPEPSTGRVHPLTAASLAGSATLLTFGIAHPLAPLVFAGAVVVAAAWARALGRLWRVAAPVVVPIVIMILVIQGLFYPAGIRVLASWGPVRISSEGLVLAWQLASRLLVATLTVVLFQLCVHPADLLATLRQRWLSPKVAYLITAPLSLVGDMSRQLAAIGEAMRSRGIDDVGVRGRVRALRTHTVPLLTGIVVNTQERADVLASRGFFNPVRPTSLRRFPDSTGQRVVRYAVPLLSAGLVMAWVGWGPR